MANKDGLFTAQLKGEFYWDLYMDIDNTKNSGSITREAEKETVVALSYNNVVKSVNSSTEGMELGLDVGGMFDVLKIEAKASLSTKATSEFESLTDTKIDKTTTTKKSDKIEVGGNSALKLYRLAFRGPGVSYSTDIISTNTSAVIEVPIEVKGRLIPVLKDIEVVYTSESMGRPDDVIQVASWNQTDINEEWNETWLGMFDRAVPVSGSSTFSYVWLRPIWTTNVSEGVTGIQVAIQPKPNEGYKDLAKGTGGDYRYLKMVRDPNSRQRITEIALWKRPFYSDEKLPSDKDYSGEYKLNANINEGRQGQKVKVKIGSGEVIDVDIRFGEMFLVWNAMELK